MRNLLILGAGTAGTMIANKLRRRLDRGEWQITIVDQDDRHHYQPGYLFLAFGTNTEKQVVRSRHAFLPDGVDFVIADIDRIDPDASTVALTDGRSLDYDYLVIATGTEPRPDQTPGMLGTGWRDTIHEFYSFDGSVALADALRGFTGGRLVVHGSDALPWEELASCDAVYITGGDVEVRGAAAKEGNRAEHEHPRPGPRPLRRRPRSGGRARSGHRRPGLQLPQGLAHRHASGDQQGQRRRRHQRPHDGRRPRGRRPRRSAGLAAPRGTARTLRGRARGRRPRSTPSRGRARRGPSITHRRGSRGAS